MTLWSVERRYLRSNGGDRIQAAGGVHAPPPLPQPIPYNRRHELTTPAP